MSVKQSYEHFFEHLCAAILELPARGKSLFLYPHVSADGDALGSTLAFALLMEGFGVDCLILTEELLEPKLNFLPAAERLLVSTRKHQDLIAEYGDRQGVGMIIDSPGGTRIGRRLKLFNIAPQQFTMDHHIPVADLGDQALVDTKAAASCEMVTELVLFLEKKYGEVLLTESMAINLFCGMMTDTGRFTYSNTTANTLRMAAELLRFKIDIRALSLILFDRMSKAKLALIGYVDTHAQYFYQDKMVLSLLPYEVYKDRGGEEGDVEGLASFMLDVIGVELSILLRETEGGSYRASVRSGDGFDAQALAIQFNGGGHLRAAGFSLPKMTAEEAIKASVEAAGIQFEE